MSASLTRTLLEARQTLLADAQFDPDGAARLLLRTDLSGTMQVHELELAPPSDPGEAPAAATGNPLTGLPEPVARARYVPGRPRAILEIDAGGNERHGRAIEFLASVLGPAGPGGPDIPRSSPCAGST